FVISRKFHFVVDGCLVLFSLHPFPTRRSSDLQFTIMDGTLPALAYRVVHVLWQPDHNGGYIILLCYFHHFINAEMTIFRINFQSRQTLGCPSQDRKSTRLNSSHVSISYAVFCLKKKKKYPQHNPAYNERPD